MQKWAKLTKDQIEIFGFSTYSGEVVLIDSERPVVDAESFYWNAQEYFSSQEIEQMPWFSIDLFEKEIGERYEK